MARRYSPKNPRRGNNKQPSTSAAIEKPPRESRALVENYMRTIYERDPNDKFLLMLFLGKMKAGIQQEDKEDTIRRLNKFWMNNQKKYGPIEYLEELMKKYDINPEEDQKRPSTIFQKLHQQLTHKSTSQGKENG